MPRKKSDTGRITQYVLGLISTSIFCFGNYMLGWGSYEAQMVVGPPFLVINCLDTVLGRYWATDPPMLIHHGFTVWGTAYGLSLDHFNNLVYPLSYWLSLAEISSFFNNLRWFYRTTKYKMIMDQIFGSVFLVSRFLSTYGCWRVLLEEGHDDRTRMMLGGIIVLPYTILNAHWSYLIVRKFQNRQNN